MRIPGTGKTIGDHSQVVSRDGSPHTRGEGGGLWGLVVGAGAVRGMSE